MDRQPETLPWLVIRYGRATAQLVAQQLQELINGQVGVPNERAQCADRKFAVLRNRQVHAHPWLDENQVAANLANRTPTGSLKSPRGFLTRNVGESAHFARLSQ